MFYDYVYPEGQVLLLQVRPTLMNYVSGNVVVFLYELQIVWLLVYGGVNSYERTGVILVSNVVVLCYGSLVEFFCMKFSEGEYVDEFQKSAGDLLNYFVASYYSQPFHSSAEHPLLLNAENAAGLKGGGTTRRTKGLFAGAAILPYVSDANGNVMSCGFDLLYMFQVNSAGLPAALASSP
ncbi:hypothetical protein C8J57DRAFT_1233865 [Mycena rebaudengoi]|nr:hypothetical protein C8J57DRAFT_1233865 [Mycena rebaudengoi]